jgi:predicted Zn-dependent protease
VLKRTLLALCLSCNPLAAADLPDLGEVSRQYFSNQEEQVLARAIMRSIYADPLYLDDPEIETYLETLGYRLVSVSSRNQRSFNFFVIQDPSINAFALPGGNIGVHTGLLLAARSESELASVLAHEIAHVTQDHLARMVAAQTRSSWPSLAALALALLASRSNPSLASAAIASTQALSIQNQLNFTRDYEREADRLGYEMLIRAEFDPHGMSGFFDRLQRANRFYDSSAPAYLRTHPITSERIADMEARADSTPYRQIQDSLDFQLVRVRLRANEGTPADAVRVMQSELRDKRYGNEAVARYGLALAQLRARNYAGAEAEVRKIAALDHAASPMIALLAARSAREAGQSEKSLERYRAGIASYPGYRPLLYGYAQALLDAGRARDSLAFVSAQNNLWPQDIRLWRLASQAHARLGQRLQSHLAQAEALALSGNLDAAIQQINLGLKAGDGSFYDLSAAEARRRDWQELEKAQRKQ